MKLHISWKFLRFSFYWLHIFGYIFFYLSYQYINPLNMYILLFGGVRFTIFLPRDFCLLHQGSLSAKVYIVVHFYIRFLHSCIYRLILSVYNHSLLPVAKNIKSTSLCTLSLLSGTRRPEGPGNTI